MIRNKVPSPLPIWFQRYENLLGFFRLTRVSKLRLPFQIVSAKKSQSQVLIFLDHSEQTVDTINNPVIDTLLQKGN